MRWAVLLLLAAGCAAGDDDDSAADPPPPPGREFAWWCPGDAVAIEARVEAILSDLGLEEKIGLMAGDAASSEGGLWPVAGVLRHGVPGFRMVDGPRGVSGATGPATAFPVGLARGATWDPELERAVGRAMGREAAAKGANVLLAPTVNVLRHPRWGRAQETYGEDPVHIGRMGSAFVEGVQETVLASVKHLVANSIEDTRFTVDVQVDDRALREVYLRAFEPVVRDAGVATVMSAYNSVNGAYCSENAPVLDGVLRGDWGFPGIVESDWVFGTHETVPSLEAGLDVEMPSARVYGDPLRDVAWEHPELVDRAVRRILRTQLCFGLDAVEAVPASVVESAEHKALSREVAARSAVLLKNDGVFPLPPAGTLAVLGPLADAENIGDTGSSSVAPSDVVTALEGLLAAPGGWTVLGPETDPAAVDVAVVVVGLTAADEGESLLSFGDRLGLALSAEDEALIAEVSAAAPRTIVVLEGGGAITVEPWIDGVDALVHAFYPGDQGGHALADLLLGRAEFAGRLPVSVPRQEADLPPFDHESDTVTYDLWHGHRHLLREGTPARFPFGFGLSTTTFSIEPPTARRSGDGVLVETSVANTGDRPGRETVQIWLEAPPGDLERAPRELVGWAQTAELPPGGSEAVSVAVPRDRMQIWGGAWVLPPGDYAFVAARHAEDPGQAVRIALP